jgi:methylated-DNA-protein-cysteine methyltransferase related protein
VREPVFFSRVYAFVAQIPRGKVASYGMIAEMLGNPRAARTVGWAMRATPPNLKLPCHRVIRSNGELPPEGIFGPEVQRTLLEAEGVIFTEEGRVNLEKCLW